jgi:short-subunit dehydrogenase
MEASSRKLALVTGASSGIGYELAKVFAKNNYDLIINSSQERIADKVPELEAFGVKVYDVQADLATREGVDFLYSKVGSLGRLLDVAVLNAGVGASGEFVQTDFEKELNVMNLNVVYTVYLAKLVLKDMVDKNAGKILVTSSVAGEMPGPYLAVYAATKAFLQSFTEAIRYEMKDTKRNITITALQPGATETEFFERADMEDTKVGQMKKDDPAEVAQQGFDALMAGKDHIVAGSLMNKVKVSAGKLMTEPMKSASHASETRPDSLKH